MRDVDRRYNARKLIKEFLTEETVKDQAYFIAQINAVSEQLNTLNTELTQYFEAKQAIDSVTYKQADIQSTRYINAMKRTLKNFTDLIQKRVTKYE